MNKGSFECMIIIIIIILVFFNVFEIVKTEICLDSLKNRKQNLEKKIGR
jgi:hypothetical protein